MRNGRREERRQVREKGEKWRWWWWVGKGWMLGVGGGEGGEEERESFKV